MTATSVLLVGVDGSPTGRCALDWAVEEAVARGWSLLLVTAWSVPHVAGVDADIGQGVVDADAVHEGARQVLLDAEEVVRAHPDPPSVSTRVEVGDAAGVLVAASSEAGLAVVGKRGRGGFTARLLGGVSIALPAHAHCPTVVVPLGARHGEAPPGDAGTAGQQGLGEGSGEPAGRPPDTELTQGDLVAETDLHRAVPRGAVVVGVDGSTGSDAAAFAAALQARRVGAPLVLLCGVPLTSPALGWMPVGIDPAPLTRDAERGVAACAGRVRDRAPGLDVRHVVVPGSPPRALADASRRAGLVVVGARGHGGFAGMLLGSVSQSVLAHARCPVLVVPRWCPPTEPDEDRENGPQAPEPQ